ncbi:MAG TPA: GTPase HflX [Thermoanaerobaculaceae bacterium]|nr:GTPase HflX [Thermoanaerobaculaceae bacterium]
MVERGSHRSPRQAPQRGHGRDRGGRQVEDEPSAAAAGVDEARVEDESRSDAEADATVELAAPAARDSGTGSARERAVLVGVVRGGEPRPAVVAHLDELAQLVDTAGGEAVARMVQERKSPDPTFFIGRGKVGELAALLGQAGARSVVFDDDLSPSQVRHLEEGLPEGVKVLDRTAVILDIFALRARTREAQTQVELAQLSYLRSRLTRRWAHLSRQAGGIGTRGVGETQLESDRRVIRRRIALLQERLSQIEREREVQRRRRAQLPAVAIVGYTNAGKSTLFERLTGAETLVEDRLFATLDPRTRRAELGDGLVVSVSDTVGFIRKLPHHLVASFRATLAEAVLAQVVVHLVDVSHADWEEQLAVGEEVLASLGVEPRSCIVGLNKIDRIDAAASPAPAERTAVRLSARSGEGVDALRAAIARAVLAQPDVAALHFPAEGGEALQRALREEHVIARRFGSDGIELLVRRRR